MKDTPQGEQHPGVEAAPAATRGFRLNHSMVEGQGPASIARLLFPRVWHERAEAPGFRGDAVLAVFPR